MEGSPRGFYERTEEADWSPFQPFAFWPDLNTHDPDLKFVDLTGDGHADILVTEGEVLTWYPSLAEDGFGPAVRVDLPLDEEKGPRLVFADGTQSIRQGALLARRPQDLRCALELETPPWNGLHSSFHVTAVKCGKGWLQQNTACVFDHCTSILGANNGPRRSFIHAFDAELVALDL